MPLPELAQTITSYRVLDEVIQEDFLRHRRSVLLIAAKGLGKTWRIKKALTNVPHLYAVGHTAPTKHFAAALAHADQHIVYDDYTDAIRNDEIGELLKQQTECVTTRTVRWDGAAKAVPRVSFDTTSPILLVLNAWRAGATWEALADRCDVFEFAPSAIEWVEQVRGWLEGEGVAGFKPPRARPLEHREALSAEQCRRLLATARGHYLEVPIALGLFAGLSRADLRPLTWKEIDLDAGLIGRPRHKTGTRLRLPVSAPLKEVLERQRQRSGKVCPRLPESESSLYKALHRLMDRAGVPRSGWHQLRHTAATLLAAAGTDVATIGRILGHRPGSVVTLRYLHTDDERLRTAAAAVALAVSEA